MNGQLIPPSLPASHAEIPPSSPTPLSLGCRPQLLLAPAPATPGRPLPSCDHCPPRSLPPTQARHRSCWRAQGRHRMGISQQHHGKGQGMEEGPELRGAGPWPTWPPPGPAPPWAYVPGLPSWSLQAAVRSEPCWQLEAMPMKPPPRPTVPPCRPGFPSWSLSSISPEGLTCTALSQRPPAPAGTGRPQLPATAQ